MAQPIQKPSRKLAWTLTACLLVAGVSFVGMRWLMPQSGTETAKKSAAEAKVEDAEQQKVESYTVATVDIPKTILITGELKASLSRDILVPDMQRQGTTMITFLAPEGTEVKKGERIVEFDTSSQASQRLEAQRVLDERKLKIDKTKVDLESQRNDLLSALSDVEGTLKVAELYAKIPKEIQPANQYQKYQLDKEKAILARDKAKEKLANLDATATAQISLVEIDKAQAEVDLKKIENDIAALQIDSPQDGIIIYGDNRANNRKFQVGDNAFQRQVVVTIPDLATMQVIGYVYDTELKFLSPGMVCNMSLDAIPGKTFRGRVLSLTSVAGRKSLISQQKVFKATIQPDKVEVDVWKPGMTVRVEVPLSLGSGVVGVPRAYIGLDRMGRYYVLKGTDPKTATMQLIKVESFGDGIVQISSGLKAGDKILKIGVAAEAKS